MSQKSQAAAAVDRMFADMAGASQSVLLNLLPPPGADPEGAPSIFDGVAVMITEVPAARVDGTTILPNDESVLIPAAALDGEIVKPGDSIRGAADGLTRSVITAHLDSLGVLWTCVVRRSYTS
jgi:hypothetical protein